MKLIKRLEAGSKKSEEKLKKLQTTVKDSESGMLEQVKKIQSKMKDGLKEAMDKAT